MTGRPSIPSPPSRKRDLIVLGFFPPPFHGQAIWTQGFAESMRDDWNVHCVNLSPPHEEGLIRWKTNLNFAVVGHYFKLRAGVMRTLRSMPDATVVWPAISPTTLGHLRDLMTIVPAFRSMQRVFGVAHVGSFDRLFRSALTRHTAAGVIRRLSGLVFLQPTLSERCAEWVPASRRFVIPNTVARSMLVSNEEASEKLQERSGADLLRILYVSNMIEPKGYLDLVEALAILQRRSVPLEASFAGSWASAEDRNRFSALVNKKGLDGIVRELGMVTDRKVVRQLFIDSDVFVLPSRLMEAQPLSIIEAMNAATPVVVTKVGGIANMVEDGKEGFFVEPCDPESIANAVEKLADRTTWREQSLAARRRFERDYHPSKVREEWNRLLRRIDV